MDGSLRCTESSRDEGARRVLGFVLESSRDLGAWRCGQLLERGEEGFQGEEGLPAEESWGEQGLPAEEGWGERGCLAWAWAFTGEGGGAAVTAAAAGEGGADLWWVNEATANCCSASRGGAA